MVCWPEAPVYFAFGVEAPRLRSTVDDVLAEDSLVNFSNVLVSRPVVRMKLIRGSRVKIGVRTQI